MWKTLWVAEEPERPCGRNCGWIPEPQQPMVTASRETGAQAHSHVRVEERPESTGAHSLTDCVVSCAPGPLPCWTDAHVTGVLHS